VTAAAAVRPATAHLTAASIATFSAAVFMLLIYSQGWEMPLLGENGNPADSGLIRALYLPAYAVGIGLLALTPWNVVLALIRQPFLILLLAVVVASIFWSVSPDQTARRIFAVYCTTLCGVVLAARWRWATLAEILATAFAVLAVVSAVTGLFIPSIGRMVELFPGAWRGVWPEKNAFGGIMSLGFVIFCAAAAMNPRRAPLWWGMAALAVGLMLMSTSKTSVVSAMLGVGAMGFIAFARRGPASSVAATWAAILGVLLLVCFIVFASDAFFGLLGKDATLTGRTKIWSAIMRQISERPWFGYGYGAIWDEEGGWGPLAWITHDAGFRARHAHNTWLEQWLGLGLPGLFAWGAFFLQAFVLALIAVYRHRGAYLAFPFFVVYALMTLTESVAVTYNDIRWVIFVALAVKLALPEREVEEATA
jgi:exopolysaccharide production protein ExoQ